MQLNEFDFDLPDDLIAQEPLNTRSASRMLVVDRSLGQFSDSRFSTFPELLRENDVLVLNNTKVFPARLLGESETGAHVETFLIRDLGSDVWQVLARPAKRLPVGKKVLFGKGLEAEIVERYEDGKLAVKFSAPDDISMLIDRLGKTPLPPYIKRDANEPDADRDRYQTVFARSRGAIAAPTAGLHFTPEILNEIRGLGVIVCEVTLHVGYGTFEPVRVEELSQHKVLPEEYEIGTTVADVLNDARTSGRRIVAVGTTTTRTLENAINKHGRFVAERSFAELTITPGYKFRAVNALLTNFHLPKSSLLVLVSTFAGHELAMSAYGHAVKESYRFYSYGDCMFIS